MKRLMMSLVVLLVACPSAPTPVATPEAEREPERAPVLTVGGGSARPTHEHHRLANGLDVWLFPDDSAPLVNVQVWVEVGSADEHEKADKADHGITGLSHFFEHLMFEGTAKYPHYDETLNPVGAQNNAFTYNDATAYWVYTPRASLDLVLDMEADRFEHMQLDFLHLEPQREVVKGERRQSVDGDASAIAEEQATRLAFDHAPYRWGTIGWLSDLDAITLEEAQAYHRAHYVPAGAYLVIVGDFDPAATMKTIESLWGAIPAGPSWSDRPAPAAETWVGPRADHVIEDSPATKVVWAFRSPPPGGATMSEYAALEVIDYVLTAGKAGRLQKRLVFGEAPKLSRLGASLFLMRDPWIYSWHADVLDGATVGSVEAVLDEELGAIARDGVSDDELARAVASLRTDLVQGGLSFSDRAEAIGFSLRATGTPLSHFDRLDAYAALTSEQIRAAAAKWLVPTVRTRVVVVTPSRLVALADTWEEALPGRPLKGQLSGAATWFVAAEQHRKAVDEADREERAIAMLAQRADVAKAAEPTSAREIDKYLAENASGTIKRKRALAATRKQLGKTALTLEHERKQRLQALAQSEKGAVRMPAPAMMAARLLLSPPGDFEGPARPEGLSRDLNGAQALALQTVASWVLESRSLDWSAQAARKVVLREGPGFVGAAATPLVQASYALSHDMSVEGVERWDRPNVQPTHGPTFRSMR